MIRGRGVIDDGVEARAEDALMLTRCDEAIE